MGIWNLVALLGASTTARYLRNGMPFNIGWWGFTFPIGVYSAATLTLARIMHLEFLAIFGGLLVASLTALWLLIASRTVHGAWKGYLFVSPCLIPGSIPEDLLAEGVVVIESRTTSHAEARGSTSIRPTGSDHTTGNRLDPACINRCADLITSAEAELSALMWAVRASSGETTALVAAEYWVAELEAATLDFDAPVPDWRPVTLATVDRLVRDGLCT